VFKCARGVTLEILQEYTHTSMNNLRLKNAFKVCVAEFFQDSFSSFSC
jgi:hypothetical protein